MLKQVNRRRGCGVEAPVDFENLHAIAGGDRSAAITLLQACLESLEDCMMRLRAACAAGDESQWRQQAHALKGVCLNVGAGTFGALSNQAQIDWRASTAEKKVMLAALEGEYISVQRAISHEMKM